MKVNYYRIALKDIDPAVYFSNLCPFWY